MSYNYSSMFILLQLSERLNSSLAFFLHDLLSVMDRGFVFSLIRIYMKEVGVKINSAQDPLHLWNLQVSRVLTLCQLRSRPKDPILFTFSV